MFFSPFLIACTSLSSTLRVAVIIIWVSERPELDFSKLDSIMAQAAAIPSKSGFPFLRTAADPMFALLVRDQLRIPLTNREATMENTLKTFFQQYKSVNRGNVKSEFVDKDMAALAVCFGSPGSGKTRFQHDILFNKDYRNKIFAHLADEFHGDPLFVNFKNMIDSSMGIHVTFNTHMIKQPYAPFDSDGKTLHSIAVRLFYQYFVNSGYTFASFAQLCKGLPTIADVITLIENDRKTKQLGDTIIICIDEVMLGVEERKDDLSLLLSGIGEVLTSKPNVYFLLSALNFSIMKAGRTFGPSRRPIATCVLDPLTNDQIRILFSKNWEQYTMDSQKEFRTMVENAFFASFGQPRLLYHLASTVSGFDARIEGHLVSRFFYQFIKSAPIQKLLDSLVEKNGSLLQRAVDLTFSGRRVTISEVDELIFWGLVLLPSTGLETNVDPKSFEIIPAMSPLVLVCIDAYRNQLAGLPLPLLNFLSIAASMFNLERPADRVSGVDFEEIMNRLLRLKFAATYSVHKKLDLRLSMKAILSGNAGVFFGKLCTDNIIVPPLLGYIEYNILGDEKDLPNVLLKPTNPTNPGFDSLLNLKHKTLLGDVQYKYLFQYRFSKIKSGDETATSLTGDAILHAVIATVENHRDLHAEINSELVALVFIVYRNVAIPKECGTKKSDLKKLYSHFLMKKLDLMEGHRRKVIQNDLKNNQKAQDLSELDRVFPLMHLLAKNVAIIAKDELGIDEFLTPTVRRQAVFGPVEQATVATVTRSFWNLLSSQKK